MAPLIRTYVCVLFLAVQIIGALAFLPSVLHAQTQWEPLGPFGGSVRFLVTDGKAWVYAGIAGTGVFRSSDGGRNWVLITRDLPNREIYACAIAPNGRIYCGGEGLLAVSDSHGDRWTVLQYPHSELRISNIAALSDSQVALTYPTVHILNYSIDGGITWKADIDFPGDTDQLQRGPDNTVIATTIWTGMYQYIPQQNAVISINYNFPKPVWYFITLAVLNDGTIAAYEDNNGLFVLTPQAQEWMKVPNFPWMQFFFPSDGSKLYGISANTLKASADHGMTWNDIATVPQNMWIACFAKVNGTLLISSGEGLWRSEDQGKTWVSSNTGIVRTDISCVIAYPAATVLIGTVQGGLQRSLDGGTTWSRLTLPAPATSEDNVVSIKRNSKPTLFAASTGSSRSVWRSIDDGLSWSRTNFSDTSFAHGGAFAITDMIINAKDELFVTGYSQSADSVSGMFKSADEGKTWERICAAPSGSMGRSFFLLGDSIVIMGSMTRGVYRSTNLGSSWRLIEGTSGFSAITTIIPDSASIILASSLASGIMRSTDVGLTWHEANAGLPTTNIRSLSRLPNGMLFVGSRLDKVKNLHELDNNSPSAQAITDSTK